MFGADLAKARELSPREAVRLLEAALACEADGAAPADVANVMLTLADLESASERRDVALSHARDVAALLAVAVGDDDSRACYARSRIEAALARLAEPGHHTISARWPPQVRAELEAAIAGLLTDR